MSEFEGLHRELESLDFSVDSEVVQGAKRLMGAEGRSPNVESTRRWLHSPVKIALEAAFFGFLGSILTRPITWGSKAAVRYVDGRPTLYRLQVGYLGEENTTVSQTTLLKIRSFSVDADAKIGPRSPFETTAFIGGREKTLGRDPRVHSTLGHLLRVAGLDELPQLPSILRGIIAGVSLRAYTLRELQGLKILFHAQEAGIIDILPQFILDRYRYFISYIQPRAGFFSLYTSSHRKELTPAERLEFDMLYMLYANPRADLRIIKSSVSTILRGIGAW